MGTCASRSGDGKASAKIDEMLEMEEANDLGRVKLLLLGAGESGKSTIFKQMRILYGSGFSKEACKSMCVPILRNLLEGYSIVLENVSEVDVSLATETELVISSAGTDVRFLTEPLADALRIISQSESFKEAYSRRSEYQLFDGFQYFCDRAAEFPDWGAEGFVPTTGDVLKARVRTTGIVEETYDINGVEFEIYDVGGQRNERRKWIHCFDGVTGVIFVASLSSYDQVLFEDGKTNRVVEALNLFEEISNSKWFINSDIMLFLNKRDLFEEKWIKLKIPLTVSGEKAFKYAPKIEQTEESLPQVYKYMKELFTQKYLPRKGHEKEIYVHITCATDTGNIEAVLSATEKILLDKQLADIGMMAQ